MRTTMLSLLILLVVFSTNAFSEEPSLAETEKKVTEQRAAVKEKPEDVGLQIKLGQSLVKQAEILLKQAGDAKTKQENQLKARQLFDECETLYKIVAKSAELEHRTYLTIIDQAKYPTLYKERQLIRLYIMQVGLYLPTVIRQSALSYDPKVAAEKKIREEKLRSAKELYHNGYERWRRRVVGLHYRYYEAACLVDLNDNKQAILILEQLLLSSEGGLQYDLMAQSILLFQKIKLEQKKYEEIVEVGRSWAQFNKSGGGLNGTIGERGSSVKETPEKVPTEKELREQYEQKYFTEKSATINYNTFTAYIEILKNLKPDSDAYAKKLAEQKQHAEVLLKFDNEYKTEMEKFLKEQQNK